MSLKGFSALLTLACTSVLQPPLMDLDAEQQPPRRVAAEASADGPNVKIRVTYQLTGGPDSVFTRVNGGTVQSHRRPATGLATVADSFTTPRPAIGVTINGLACVQVKRRGLLSAEVCSSTPWTYTEPDQDPPPPVVNPPTADTTYLRATFESGTYDGMTADVGANTLVAVVGSDGGVTPAQGSRMVKLMHAAGSASGSSYAQLRKRLDKNPARSSRGVFIQYRIYIPSATMVNANATTYGTDAQIKTHLFRVPSQNPADHSPAGYHGLVLGVGYTFGSKFSIAKDHLNIWIANATNAVDDGGAWTKYPRYTGNAWLTVQEWYQTSDGVTTQYKLWLNGKLAKAEAFNNADGSINKLIGGATTTPYEFRVGMPYLVNRSTGPYVVYLDDVTIQNGPIT